MRLPVLVIVFYLLACCTSAHAQSSLTIAGRCPYTPDGTSVTLEVTFPFKSVIPHQQILYTTTSANHRFSFLLHEKTTERWSLLIGSKYMGAIFLEPGRATIQVTDRHTASLQVFTNKAATDYAAFTKMIGLLRLPPRWYLLKVQRKQALPTADSTALAAIGFEMDSLEKIFTTTTEVQAVRRWVMQHPSSAINSYLITMYLYKAVSNAESAALFNAVSVAAKANAWGRELSYLCNRLSAGSAAPEFTRANTAGVPVSLSLFKGRYVLLHFWASWCYPCRQQNPTLVRAYNQLKNQGLSVLGISFDEAKNDWLAAIEKDGLLWTHVSDLKGWDNQVGLQYAVHSLPANFLLNQERKIIAKNIEEKDLLRVLTAAINGKK